MSFAASFERQGFLIIPRLFDPAFIRRLRSEHEERQLRTKRGGLDHQYEVGDRRIQLAVELRGAFLQPQLWANPLLLPIIRSLLGADVLLDSISLVVARAGAQEQHRHRDHIRLFPELPLETSLPPHALTVMVPLIDLDATSGTTILNPGTHRGDALADPVPAFVPEGGCYLMHYDLQHWGSANRSNRDRPLLTMTYARPWFTDCQNFSHNPRLNISADHALSLPEEHWPLFRRLHPSPLPQVRSHKLSRGDAA
nr:phytanoyl-CoA dioxygenase family protein [uncultured Sphingomonas sp.]